MIVNFDLHGSRNYVRISQIFSAILDTCRYEQELRIESLKCVREIAGTAAIAFEPVPEAACTMLGRVNGRRHVVSVVTQQHDGQPFTAKPERKPEPDSWRVENLEFGERYEGRAELKNIHTPVDLFAAAIDANKKILEHHGAKNVRFGALKGLTTKISHDYRGYTVPAFIDSVRTKRIGPKVHAFGMTFLVLPEGTIPFDVAFSFDAQEPQGAVQA